MDWIKKQEPSIYCLREMYLASKDIKKLLKNEKKKPAKQMEAVTKRHSCP